MSNTILINAIDRDECRIAKVKEGKLEEFHIENASREIIHGNIYKGLISRIVPSLQAVFVDYGAERNGFLQKHEIHSDYFQDTHSGERSIENLVKKGQELLVQVTKDPSQQKGAMLTTFISLPGRYLVLMPGSNNRGISRKIETEEERSRLKVLIGKLNVPEGFGIIVRTVGNNCNKTLLSRDMKYLLRLWKNIKKKGIKVAAPAMLYKERNLVLRSIRDYFTSDVTEILVDDETVYNEVKDFIKIISAKHIKIVKYYQDPKPIFSKYKLEDQLSSIFESRVDLKSGGSIVIEQTEALVAIDVNSGRTAHKKSVEQTALVTNLEAAAEIARQLRLRDLGGLIVIDFIDLRDPRNKSAVERALRTNIKDDKARTTIGKITKFGLMEMSRQRIRPSIEFSSFEPCNRCQGKGMIPSTETLGLSFLRKLHLEIVKKHGSNLSGTVPANVADYLLNKKRKEIHDIEVKHHCSIMIEGDDRMLPSESKITIEGKGAD
ncbi:MAG: ribonuclease E/G [Desulfobacterales bacterium]